MKIKVYFGFANSSMAFLHESVWVHQWQKAISFSQHSCILHCLFLQANTGAWCVLCYLDKCLCILKSLLLFLPAVIHSLMPSPLCVWESKTKWMTQLKAIQQSKAQIKTSPISRQTHVDKETQKPTHRVGMHWSLQAGCVKSINSSASSLLLFLNPESWLT